MVVVVIVFLGGNLRDFGLGCLCNLGMVNAKFTITRICSTSVRLPLWIPCKEEEVVLAFKKRERVLFANSFVNKPTLFVDPPPPILTSDLLVLHSIREEEIIGWCKIWA